MKTKQEIAANWLERYTHHKVEDFNQHLLITNFNNYIDLFCDYWGEEKPDYDANMRTVHSHGMSIINFGMGSPNAALIMDLLSAIKPKACLFLGKCGSLKAKAQVGDYILPLASIRGEGTSNDYFPPEIPALPAFILQQAVATVLRDSGMDYWADSVYTTNRRLWEHDAKFREYLVSTRAIAVEMESATLFSCGYYNRIPVGALLLVSDEPMMPEGVKTMQSDRSVTQQFAAQHVEMGIRSLQQIIDNAADLRHIRY